MLRRLLDYFRYPPVLGLRGKGLGAIKIAGITVGTIILVGGIPTLVPVEGAATANLWLSATAANDCTGGRSSTDITYDAAVTGNNVCQKWSTACTAATGGDNVRVKDGTFAEETPGGAYTEIAGDCSDAAGNAVDPTAQAPNTDPGTVISNWVTFECADSGADEVILDVKYFIPSGNSHMYVKGNCFYFGTIMIDFEGANGTRASNFITDDVHMQGFQVNGGDNIWFTSSSGQWEFGPVVLCGQDGGPEPEAGECDATGSLIGFAEHRWANRSNGSSDLQSQGRVNPDADSNHSTDVVVENVWWHDSQSKDSAPPGSDWHTGCGFVLDNVSADTDNVIYRNILCERVAHQGMYVSESSGVTVENMQIPCPVEPLDNVGESNWGTTNCNQRAFHINCTAGCSNLLLRYNNFVTAVDFIDNTNVGTNVRAVGNVADQYIACPTDMTVKDYNVYVAGSACGTNGVDIVSTPFVDTAFGSSPTSSTEIDLHLSGSAGSHGFEDDITPTSADYALTKDMDGATRTSGSRDPGADER